MTEFKVGDQVYVKDVKIGNHKYGWKQWRDDAVRGKVFRIQRDEYDGHFSVGSGVHVPAEYLTLVPEFKEGDKVVLKNETPTYTVRGFDGNNETSHEISNPDDFAGKVVKLGEKWNSDFRMTTNEGEYQHINPKHIDVEATMRMWEKCEDSYESLSKNPVVVVREGDEDPKEGDAISIFRFENESLSEDVYESLFKVSDYKSDPVNPDHYKEHLYEPIEVIEDWELSFCAGNALKYIGRYQKKGKPVEDLRKAIWYLEREIDSLEDN